MTDNNRQYYNKKILELISEAVQKYPDWRFGQILSNLGLPSYRNDNNKLFDAFFEEPKATYNKMSK